ncbi:uncharacterized protein B0I36DRAFT_313466 [Microdochium trichocladiopsis]|uniref:Uncharacterized protein n=1 Tax=Microdochium trichocladiopsis TaxID=1682393 RepID=A0A9P8YD71_9PEZI|nr:uncharacterized protein B0I36DRAFT_313466 [Microdochium trichocladiopsis]KAH7037173.1 hypothetical protein B0I36DRAFT_313466 [Microdochium trichocladiopsis]
MEWRFGSFRCQCESARQAIARERKNDKMTAAEREQWEGILVEFSKDPCAPNDQ